MVNSARPRRIRVFVLLRALVCLVVLLALAVGLPVVLWQATVAALPAGLDGLTHLFSRQETTGVLLLVLAAIGWVGWLGFVLSVAVEVPAQLRGRISPRLPGFRFGQRAAATLVGSILMLLPAGTALASPAHVAAATATAAPGPAAKTAADAAHAPVRQTSDDGRSRAAPRDERSYTVREVRPAESLWSIAEKVLGDGSRWTAIAEANKGRTMPDGTVFRADGYLQPGWTLRLPAPPHSTAPPPQGEVTRSVTVTAGQTLSGIAEKELGDASRYPEIFEANRDEPQPGGRHFTDPDVLYPGQRLDLPAQAHSPGSRQHGDRHTGPRPETHQSPERPHGTERAPAHRDDGTLGPEAPRSPGGSATASPHDRTTRSPDRRASPGHDDHQRTDGGASAAVPPAAPRPSTTVSPKPSASTSAPAPSAPAETDARTDRHDTSGLDVWKLAGVGALLAASLAGGLGIKRILQQRRRRVGETIAMPEEASSLEQALTAAAEPASVQLLDTALRTLHHHLLDNDLALPELRGARVTGRTVELLVDDPAAAPIAPFAEGDGGWWTLPETAELLEPDEARGVPAPWPGLVTVGSSPDGDLLLMNLPHTRTVLLEGEESDVRTVIRAIAMEAATCGWADRTEILTVGLGDELSTLLPQGRVRAVPHLRAATRDLGELLLEHHQVDDAEAKPLPWLLICATEASAEDAWELADAVAAARDLPVALVLPAAHTAPCFPEAEILHAGRGDAQACAALSEQIMPQRVEDADYAQFIADLRVADEPARPAQGPWCEVPEAEGGARVSVPELVEEMPQATPFAALTATAGPATVHLMPTASGEEPPDPEDKPAAGGRGNVVALVKGPSQTPLEHLEPLEDLDLEAPEVRVLGPVAVTGIAPSGHGGKLAALAALVLFKPGRTADALCEAMDPNSPWSRATLQSRMSELRSRLGTNAEGELYLPRDRSSGYRLSPEVRCDWTRFQQLAERGLTLGPDRGLDALEEALSLVRGRPFADGDHAWAAPLLQEMLSRITDVAHTIATWRRVGPAKDLDAARRAIATGLDVDDTAELLYQDWMRTEHAASNPAGVHRAIQTLQEINRRLDVSMEPETEETIQEILSGAAQARLVERSMTS